MQKSDEKLLELSRRSLLRGGGVALGGLVLSAWLPPLVSRSAAAEATAAGQLGEGSAEGFGAFVRVARDGRVTVISPKIEMGQGAQTGIAMMVAEELEVGLDRVSIQEAPPNSALYTDSLLQFQATGGSTSTRYTWEPLRRAGATARILLLQAAALRWKVAPSRCRAENGQVLGPDGQQAGYGELVDAAAALPLPQSVPLKTPEQFKLLGTRAQRLDTPAKVNGSARFTIDLQVPGMLVASSLTCPVHGGRLRLVDDRQARQVAGVRDIVRLDNAVAVTASNFWACQQALKALRIEWDLGPHAAIGSRQLDQALIEASGRDGVVAKREGDIEQARQKATSQFEAVYEQALLSHSPLEPMSCVAHVRTDGCDLWVGTQVPVFAQQTAAKVTGLPLEQIQVHNQLIGGAFGRRLEFDFITQAVAIARQVDYPIKLIWSREEDMTHDLYRPLYADRLQAALDEQGRPLGWEHRIAGASILARYVGSLPPSGVDADAVEVAIEPIYRLPHLQVRYIRQDPEVVPVSWWRGVGPLRSTYALECFIDELAHNAKADPVSYRLGLMEGQPRAQAVLRLLAEKSDWSRPLPAGQGRGVAVSAVFGSYVATLVELEMHGESGLRIKRLVSVVDCGFATNPTSVIAQIEGGTLFGLSASLFNEILIENGRVQQNNFHTYRQLRISEAPPVEVHLVPSLEAPGGVGEAGTALIGPALVNALHAASGKRIRRLPLSRFGYYPV
ncbi:TPA: molybdopterin cofactor-binding domain-containing protein [Pseudomonas aeruginosa]|uniref:xanthine dehydrogenase family protein molybdopterin-binding subunit n=1 Tax=Pseudomonas citronellolis TaxID=53408 RepID=UPI001A1C6F76|nr:molybdopterin cofactor-binding domain-containing protein [Pseudomonas citronellolis]MBH3547428.1 xanthine dehydrogenase family protein molybdopterin-binding subunit [Pseudomonas aeruginosa]UUC47455.1 molybdopterin-dependent oxidoreductase [Pseudomonas citronellolis]HBN9703310.1 xanthine dehydrogenase family protein molybdopterin-binding subunit [Pseudomonas aeruginosa]HBN9721858.1 xanthine dehydrogenase family protein molybdopterin-binding subunit [Pseudomonas aeruginosa]HBN9767937.1 xanthi